MEAQRTQNYYIYIEFSNEEQYLRFQDILQDVKGLKYTHPQPLRSNFYCHINYSLKTDKPNTEPLRFYVIICVINHGDTPDLTLGAAVTRSADVCFLSLFEISMGAGEEAGHGKVATGCPIINQLPL